MKTIIKLTNEYASNLNCLFFNFNSKLDSYNTLCESMFKSYFETDAIDLPQYNYIKMVDIVFIKIDNHSKFENLQGIREFIQSLRKTNEFLPVYFINESITESSVFQLIDKCYCMDGFLPTPFDSDRIYRFLHRVLKRLVADKELHVYIKDLEEQLSGSIVSVTEEKKVDDKPVQSSQKRDIHREKDIRFTQTDKISALEFMSSLDDSIIDKVENLEIELDSLIEIIYRMENSDSTASVDLVQNSVKPIIDDIYVLVDSIGYFVVTARAFRILNDFLTTLTPQEFENQEQKSMFITMLLAVINDLEKWLKVIFIEHSTDDIHYLDASFSSNILEIEQVFFQKDNDDDEDDDDLEFF